MGQYWVAVNIDKREYIDPHKMGVGMKLWEHLANHPGTGAALIILQAAMPETRGGGDFDIEDNYQGPERKDFTGPGPMPEEYPDIARRTIGRWAGDRVVLLGDYCEEGDIKNSPMPEPMIYALCSDPKYIDEESGIKAEDLFTDITEDVKKVIAHELCGEYVEGAVFPFFREVKR